LINDCALAPAVRSKGVKVQFFLVRSFHSEAIRDFPAEIRGILLSRLFRIRPVLPDRPLVITYLGKHTPLRAKSVVSYFDSFVF